MNPEFQNPSSPENRCNQCDTKPYLIKSNYEMICPSCGLVYDEDRLDFRSPYLEDAEKRLTTSHRPFITRTSVGDSMERKRLTGKTNYNRMQQIQSTYCNEKKLTRKNLIIRLFQNLNAQFGYNFEISILVREAETLYTQLMTRSPDRNLESLTGIIYYYYARNQGYYIPLEEIPGKNPEALIRQIWRIKLKTSAIDSIISTNKEKINNYQSGIISQLCLEYKCDPIVLTHAMDYAKTITGMEIIRSCAAFIVAASMHGDPTAIPPYKVANKYNITPSSLYARINSIATKLGYADFEDIKAQHHSVELSVKMPELYPPLVRHTKKVKRQLLAQYADTFNNNSTAASPIIKSPDYTKPIAQLINSPLIQFMAKSASRKTKAIQNPRKSEKAPKSPQNWNVPPYGFLFCRMGMEYPDPIQFFNLVKKFSGLTISKSCGPPIHDPQAGNSG